MLTPHTQRATAWLCLAVALLIALMPVAGVMVCLGHDGHVDFGATTEAGSCPCEHDAATETDPVANLAGNEDPHPPCRDVALDPPEIFNDGERTEQLPKPTGTSPDDRSPAIALGAIDGRWADQARVASLQWATTQKTARPRQQLQHRRTVVLLI